MQRVKPFFVGTYTYYSYPHYSSRNPIKLIKNLVSRYEPENEEVPLVFYKDAIA